ncbi:DegT/DnrJ/EryC1/StrS family aminotransferase [Rugosimonospora africana]|uniref:Aminotransferase n=1 Tax=Rugosimonospora africana TaxID=556532 RepID=A0A8J3QQT0_9ACTN|nr:DegT/DnrJ/EryC1/StrS family aminotransferase [Rugosimonospora africana]GIH13970.1 aminotransferase [Rugosimonospora africana]
MNTPQPIPITSVVIGAEEKAAVQRVLDSGMLAQGPVVAELERQFAELTGVPHAVAVSNGTVALVAALEALGLGPDDEVITTPFSFVATLNAILESGAKVRFADIRDDFTMDPDSVRSLVNERTRALLPVHLYGLPADMDALSEIARAHDLHLVEDAAQAHGATIADRVVGSFGVGCFSLYATKNLQCGEGGLITTSDDLLADRLRLLRNQGMRVRYQYEAAGHNWRLTDLQAAIAVPQVARLADNGAARAANAAALNEGLAGLPGLITPGVPAGRGHVWHQYTIRVTPEAPIDREDLAKKLEQARIGYGLYYPRLMHDYDCYRGHPQITVDPTPVAAQITTEVLSLPVHQNLTPSQLDRIVGTVREAFNG